MRDPDSKTEILDYDRERPTGPSGDGRSDAALGLVAVASVDPAFEGRSVLVPALGITLGREILGVNDPAISREHARVTPSEHGDGVDVVGTSPTNGCYFQKKTWGHNSVFSARVGECFRTGGTVWVIARGASPSGAIPGLGASSTIRAAMRTLERLVSRVADELRGTGPVTTTLLITGPRGAGKNRLVQVFVRRITEALGASRIPLVDLNVARLQKGTAAADLFGVTKGYATGVEPNPGAFSAASGGVLLLDEVAELDPVVQPELNTALSEPYTFSRRGSRTKETIRCVVVSATNAHFPTLMARGGFREDLYDRLSAHVIHLSGLDDRKEDLLFAIRTLLGERGLRPLVPPNIAMDLLEASWPGSFRELRKLVDRVVVALSEERRTVLEARDTPWVTAILQDLAREHVTPNAARAPSRPDVPAPPPSGVALSQCDELPIPPRAAPTRELFLRIWGEHAGNASRVGAVMGRNEKQIRRWAKAFGVGS